MSEIKKNIVQELHRSARKNFKRRSYIIKAFDDSWQADLADFSKYSKENKGYHFLLVVIDNYSKYVWTDPLNDKSGSSVTNAMRTILEKDRRKPINLQTDLGKEFYNGNFKKLMSEYNINHYSTFSVKKAAIVERVIRTLKSNIYFNFSLQGKYDWYNIINDVTLAYNNTKHNTIKMRPCDVDKNTSLSHIYSKLKICGKRKYHVGDIVRISKYKSLFEKGFTPNWTTELFKISKIKITNPTTYMLNDMYGSPIQGSFYEQEILKTKHSDVYLVERILKRKGSKAYVKWYGLDKSHNSWVNKNDVGI